MVLLDWEKAFDKVIHNKLFEALEIMIVPENTLTRSKTYIYIYIYIYI